MNTDLRMRACMVQDSSLSRERGKKMACREVIIDALKHIEVPLGIRCNEVSSVFSNGAKRETLRAEVGIALIYRFLSVICGLLDRQAGHFPTIEQRQPKKLLKKMLDVLKEQG